MRGKGRPGTGSEGLEFRLLGPIEAWTVGRPVALGGSRTRSLLAYLLLHARQTVRTGDLIEALWHDPPPTCRKIVQISVSQLRKALGDAVLVTEPRGYRLDVEPEAVDLHRFIAWSSAGGEALARGEFRAASERLGEALRLWRGRPLGDLEDDPFVAPERARLEHLRVAAHESRIEADLALGRERELIGELEHLVAREPLRERPRALLMTALYRAGRQAEALAVYQQTRRFLVAQAGIEPGPALKRLEQAILRQDASLEAATGADRRGDLPLPATSLVDRERELDEACALLRRASVRLLTITGPGGVRKTRLALEAAARVAPDFADGVTFVALDSVTDGALVAPALARALGASGSTADTAAALQDRLHGRSALIVLDSFEHLTPAAPLLAGLLGAAPGAKLKLLVTSRVSLRLSGERTLALAPLAVPARGEHDATRLAATPSVDLFVQRARAVRPELALDAENADAIAELCRRLEGLPLSIELAAARAKLLPPLALLARLGRRLDVLGSGPLDAPPRHRTLRATMDWSLRLLSPQEARLFARFGVFAGGCDLEAVEAVCGGDGEDVLATLEALITHSLVRRELRPHARIAMLETLRELAVEQLAAGADDEAVRERHARWYLAWAEQAEGELHGRDQSVWQRRLDDDHANLLAALAWFEHMGDGHRLLRLASALWRFWFTHGYITEAREWLARALAAPVEQPPALRSRALYRAAALARVQLDAAAAESLSAEALDLARRTDDVQALMSALVTAGNVLVWIGELGRARAMYEELLEVAVAAAAERPRGVALLNVGSLDLLEGEPERALRVCAEAVGILSKLDDAETHAVALFNLACALLESGDEVAGARAFEDSARLSLDGGFHESLAYCLVGVAAVAERRGDSSEAGALLGAAEALLDEMKSALAPYERALHAQTAAAVRATLGGDADRAWSAGRRAGPEEALRAALGDKPSLSAE